MKSIRSKETVEPYSIPRLGVIFWRFHWENKIWEWNVSQFFLYSSLEKEILKFTVLSTEIFCSLLVSPQEYKRWATISTLLLLVLSSINGMPIDSILKDEKLMFQIGNINSGKGFLRWFGPHVMKSITSCIYRIYEENTWLQYLKTINGQTWCYHGGNAIVSSIRFSTRISTVNKDVSQFTMTRDFAIYEKRW